MTGKIRVAVIDDSHFFRKTIISALSSDPDIEIAGEGADGTELVALLGTVRPDVITLDLIMPGRDGLWALEEVMRKRPTPVVIFSAIAEQGSEIVEQAFRLGVVDILQKPQSQAQILGLKMELVQRIKGAARIDRQKLIDFYVSGNSRVPPKFVSHSHANQVVVLCASAGGPVALQEILSGLPEDMPAGVIVAQHMPQQFLESFRKHVASTCHLPVHMGRDGDFLRHGKVIFSPGNATLTCRRLERGCVTVLERGTGSIQPCIDVTLSSAAQVFGGRTVGVVLSGMGRDGLQGASMVKKMGGIVLAQDEASCPVYGMPKAVADAGFADKILPPKDMVKTIINLLTGK